MTNVLDKNCKNRSNYNCPAIQDSGLYPLITYVEQQARV